MWEADDSVDLWADAVPDRGGGVDGGHEHELGPVVGRLVQQGVVDLGLVEAVRDEVLLIDARLTGDGEDGKRRDGMGDLDV